MTLVKPSLLVVFACTIPLLTACRGAESHVATPEAVDTTAFARLQKLVGSWTCTTDDSAVRIHYRLVSSSSVLVETFTTPSGKETLTLYHPDGRHLLATHYCGQGNQPRLRLRSSSGASFVFGFHDATNLSRRDAAHLERLQLTPHGNDALERVETYTEAGAEEVTRYACHRGD